MTTRVLVAHGSRALAEALSAVIGNEPDLEAVSTVSEPAEALIVAGRLRPDAVLADLGGGEWVPAVIAIGEAYPQIRIVLLASPGAQSVDRLAAAGAQLVDPTSGGIGAVLGALRNIGRDADQSERRVPPSRAVEPRSSALAPADLHLLRLVAAGLDSEAAARELGTGPGLVRRRLRRICTELSVESPIQAVAVALRDGALRLEPGP
ncbi:MAG: hypothetical protein WCA30_07690 [Dermatophilaceae bacterium]